MVPGVPVAGTTKGNKEDAATPIRICCSTVAINFATPFNPLIVDDRVFERGVAPQKGDLMRKVKPENIILLDPVVREGLANFRKYISHMRKTRGITSPMEEVWEVRDDNTLIVRFLGAFGNPKGSATLDFPRNEWQEKH